MLCQACHRPTTKACLCEACRLLLRPAPDQLLPSGVRVLAAFEHSGPARALAHHLKYRAVLGFAEIVASTVAPRLPPGPLVPVARSISRRARYGIDPALVLATSIARETGYPVLRLLKPPLHATRRAGGDHSRVVPAPSLRKRTLEKVLLVDDVMTTGTTLEAAVSAIGVGQVRAAVVANAVTDGSRGVPKARIGDRGFADGLSAHR